MIAEAHRAADDPSNADQLRAIERARVRALVERDMALAWQLHAPQYQLVTPGGRPFTREQYLGKIDSGVLRYLSWEPGEIAVRHTERMAIVRYQAMLALDAGDGTGTPFPCWHLDSYELIDGRWQAVWSQATKIAG